MKKILFIILLIFISCNNENNLIGSYKSKNNYFVTIKKAGKNNFIITFKLKYSIETYFTYLKNGCFFVKGYKKDYELICTYDDDELISTNGTVYHKMN